jgi:hypothetical protein
MTGIRSWIGAVSTFGVVVMIEHVRPGSLVSRSIHDSQRPSNAKIWSSFNPMLQAAWLSRPLAISTRHASRSDAGGHHFRPSRHFLLDIPRLVGMDAPVNLKKPKLPRPKWSHIEEDLAPIEDLERMMGIFKNLTTAVLAIRRSEQRDALVEIQRERLELLREKQSNNSASSSSSSPSRSRESAPAAKCNRSAGQPLPEDAFDPVHPQHTPAASPRPAPPNPPAIPQLRPNARIEDSADAGSPQNPTN